jgi:hypothetical protein
MKYQSTSIFKGFFQVAIIKSKVCQQEDMTSVFTRARKEMHKLNDKSKI